MQLGGQNPVIVDIVCCHQFKWKLLSCVLNSSQCQIQYLLVFAVLCTVCRRMWQYSEATRWWASVADGPRRDQRGTILRLWSHCDWWRIRRPRCG